MRRTECWCASQCATQNTRLLVCVAVRHPEYTASHHTTQCVALCVSVRRSAPPSLTLDTASLGSASSPLLG
ncbi:unnamed protein product [Leptidea sinapis]|uniref:Uncharacterized protein n=1 Tax=Leptidea sinapis TaxID=189913 RepID=A0A5E4Q6E5_9NEOP|nr:unnamed protein product [Leptidea sinapis]